MDLKRSFLKMQRIFKIGLSKSRITFDKVKTTLKIIFDKVTTNSKKNGFQGNVQNRRQRSYGQNRKNFQQDSRFSYQTRNQNCFQHQPQKSSPTRHFDKMEINAKKMCLLNLKIKFSKSRVKTKDESIICQRQK